MHEINVLTVKLLGLYIIYISYELGGYPELNREHIVPHTIVLPIELYPPKIPMLGWLEHPIINTKNLGLTY